MQRARWSISNQTAPLRQGIWKGKICTWQWGQTKPLIFSTMPNTLTSILRQKLSSLRIVAKATSWGVVTRIAPFGLTFFSALTTVRCSSDVPGGVSEGGEKVVDQSKEKRVINRLMPNAGLRDGLRPKTHLPGERRNNHRDQTQGNHNIIGMSFSKSSIFKMFFFLSTLKRKASISKFFQFKKLLPKAPFSWRISVDGRPNSRTRMRFQISPA